MMMIGPPEICYSDFIILLMMDQGLYKLIVSTVANIENDEMSF